MGGDAPENRDLIFNPVLRGAAGEEIAWQIEAAILGGHIEPGERLPSERELQARFKTGRGVIREALGALKQKGLLEIRKGVKGGAYVKTVDVSKAGESLALLLRQQQIPIDYLIEFRESIDRSITQLAVARADREEKEVLCRNTLKLRELAGRPEPDLGGILNLDRQLNTLFVKMSKNLLFEWIILTIQSGFGSYDNALYENTTYRMKTAVNWVHTAREIAANEPLRALSHISLHYAMLRQCLKETPGVFTRPDDSGEGDQ